MSGTWKALLDEKMSRRSLLGGAAAAAGAAALPIDLLRAEAPPADVSLTDAVRARTPGHRTPPFKPIQPTTADALVLPEGYRFDVVRMYGDEVAPGLPYGYNNDFVAYMPIDGIDGTSSDDGLLWVNHENPFPLLLHGNPRPPKTPEQIEIERMSVGGSIFRVRRGADGRWRLAQDPRNRRITANTPCRLTGPAAGSAAVHGATMVEGSVANCSGGVTPWGTILTCEENFQDYRPANRYGWGERFIEEHHGWVTEIDPYNPTYVPQKRTAMGRFRHENVAITVAPSGRVVAYMGDDKIDSCVYKFVSAEAAPPAPLRGARTGAPGAAPPAPLRGAVPPNSGGDGALGADRVETPDVQQHSNAPPKLGGQRGAAARGGRVDVLEHGKLYAADFGNGRWLLLDYDSQPALRDAKKADGTPLFRDQADVLTDARSAALLIGATPADRPEDLEVHPHTGHVYISLTNNQAHSNYHGQIVRIKESGDDPESLTFDWDFFAVGGPQSGFSSPDNLVFDVHGNLWMCTDISGSRLNRGIHEFQGNNSLFFFATEGPDAGRAYQFASGPNDCELCGPSWTPDGKTLFLSVQHPGSNSRSLDTLTSHWPLGGNETPRPAVVAITGFPGW